jgi:hypothetical protein
MTTYIGAYCAKDFESAQLDAYVQSRKDDNGPLGAEDIARFVCSEVCGRLADEREPNKEV